MKETSIDEQLRRSEKRRKSIQQTISKQASAQIMGIVSLFLQDKNAKPFSLWNLTFEKPAVSA
jgi:hypothetical protein